jgi:histidinol dehydrogenase
MTGIPAQLAGCKTVVLCTPASRDGSIDPATAWAALRCGIHQVVLAGGAHAVAAMAFGTASVPAVDKLFGPGGPWVTVAKQQAAAEYGIAIDMPAGPSEVLIIADSQARPDFVAADLLAQLEHGADSQAILVTTCRDLASAVAAEIERQVPRLERAEVIGQSLQFCRLIVVTATAEAISIANRYAPEHLVIHAADADPVGKEVEAAGSIFLGPWTPEVLGDYCSGTNHVLPTGGWARSLSGLSVTDFMKRVTVQRADGQGFSRLAPVAAELARCEGLTAHEWAITVRENALAEAPP